MRWWLQSFRKLPLYRIYVSNIAVSLLVYGKIYRCVDCGDASEDAAADLFPRF